MIRLMEKRVPRKHACPKCGSFCECERTKKIPQDDSTVMRVQYRYCTKAGCDGTVKNAEIIDLM